MKRKNRYLYRSRRDDDRVRRDYIGCVADPAVALLARRRRLNSIMRREQLKRRSREDEQLRCDEPVLQRLSDSIGYWPLLDAAVAKMSPEQRRQLLLCRSDDDDRGPLLLESMEMIPTQREFQSLCKAAEEGDPAAIEQLNGVLRQVPEVVAGLTDLVSAGRRLVIEYLANDSVVANMAFNQKIGHQIDLLIQDNADDPLGRLFAEVVAVAYLDALRSSLGSTRHLSSQRASKQWSGASNRSATRFDRIASAYRKHQQRWLSTNPAVPARPADVAAMVTNNPNDLDSPTSINQGTQS